MNKSKKGLTLIELLAVMGVSAIFGALVLMISLSTGKLFNMANTDTINNDRARLIIGTIEDDLKVASNIIGTPNPLIDRTSITIDSTTYNFDPSKYTYVGGEKVLLSFKNPNGLYAYVKTNNGIKIMKFNGTVFTDISGGFEGISEVKITKSAVATDNKRFMINIVFDDGAEYSSAITPRN